MERQGFHDSAADWRRDDFAHSYGGQNRRKLFRPGRSRFGRQQSRRRRSAICFRKTNRTTHLSRKTAATQDSDREAVLGQARSQTAACHSKTRARVIFRSSGNRKTSRCPNASVCKCCAACRSTNWRSSSIGRRFSPSWELRGPLSRNFEDEVVGETARELYNDAQKILNDLFKRKTFEARARVGFLARQRRRATTSFCGLTPTPNAKSRAFRCCASKSIKRRVASICRSPISWRRVKVACTDYVGGFAVSIHGAEKIVDDLQKQATTTISAFLVQSLADRLAEAFAEWLHQKARDFCGIDENLSSEDIGRREISRHPSGVWLSGVPRPHAQKTLVRVACKPSATRASTHRKHGDVAASSVSGIYLNHPQSALFRGRKNQ